MAAWHRSLRADLGLRAMGLLLCCISYAALVRLAAAHARLMPPDAVTLSLTATGFVAASAGGALLVHGKHLFDPVQISARWRIGRERLRENEGNMSVNDSVESVMLVIGRDVDGSWTVRESAGMLLGRFASAEAADRFARAERREKPVISIATSAGSARRLQGRLSLGFERQDDGDVAHG